MVFPLSHPFWQLPATPFPPSIGMEVWEANEASISTLRSNSLADPLEKLGAEGWTSRESIFPAGEAMGWLPSDPQLQGTFGVNMALLTNSRISDRDESRILRTTQRNLVEEDVLAYLGTLHCCPAPS